MFAAAIAKTTPWYQHLAFNSFDLALVAMLAFGFWRGRKRGMSRECLPLLFWLGVVFAGGFGYAIVGDQFLNGSAIKTVYGKHFTNRTAVFVWSYLLIMLVVYIIYAALARAFKAKLEGSNAFGGSEYYLGIVAGILRYACILLAALALLNAPFYSAQELAASKLYKLNTYAAGGVKGMENDTGEFIPDLPEIQTGVFKNSLLGPFIKNSLGFLLINTTAPDKKPRATGSH